MNLNLLVLPFCRDGERTTIDTRRITFYESRVTLSGRCHHIGRINLKCIAATAVNGRSVTIHLPIPWNGERFPLAIVEIIFPKTIRLFIGCLCPIELPISIEGNLTRMMEIGTRRFTIYLKDALIIPIVSI